VLLEHLYDVYKADGCTSEVTAPEVASTATSIFLDAIRNLTPPQQRAAVTEIEMFFSGAYPCLDGDVLKWWKVSLIMYILLLPPTTALQIHTVDFPVLARIARDILAIPGVSISVERLFSSSKHTLSDARSAMTAESASKTIVAKEWLKKGFGVGINYLDDVRILT
jgi:hAT family C-terminal dimerisation region